MPVRRIEDTSERVGGCKGRRRILASIGRGISRVRAVKIYSHTEKKGKTEVSSREGSAEDRERTNRAQSFRLLEQRRAHAPLQTKALRTTTIQSHARHVLLDHFGGLNRQKRVGRTELKDEPRTLERVGGEDFSAGGVVVTDYVAGGCVALRREVSGGERWGRTEEGRTTDGTNTADDGFIYYFWAPDQCRTILEGLVPCPPVSLSPTPEEERENSPRSLIGKVPMRTIGARCSPSP